VHTVQTNVVGWNKSANTNSFMSAETKNVSVIVNHEFMWHRIMKHLYCAKCVQ